MNQQKAQKSVILTAQQKLCPLRNTNCSHECVCFKIINDNANQCSAARCVYLGMLLAEPVDFNKETRA